MIELRVGNRRWGWCLRSRHVYIILYRNHWKKNCCKRAYEVGREQLELEY